MFGNQSVFMNDGRMEIEGTFYLNSSAAVISVPGEPTGVVKTVTGQGLSVVLSSTGTYTVTAKTSNAAQGPVVQPVEILYAQASPLATTLATVLTARIGAVTVSATGDITFTVITAASTGAAVATTAAIAVSFEVILGTKRMDAPL